MPADHPLFADARPAEAHALAIARDLPGERIVCTSLGWAQAARTLAADRPSACVTAWFLDLYRLERAREASLVDAPAPAIVLSCTPDMPAGPLDLVVLPLTVDGEAELTRELIQQAMQRLRLGGRLVTAIDNPRDTWLREQLAATGERVRVRPAESGRACGVAYLLEKTTESKRIRDFRCGFRFRDRGRLLEAVSRPGVFAHRRIDPAARHLLNAVDVAPGTHVLDIGCGSGCVAIGIAARDERVRVHAIDSAARAVECTREGVARNGLANVTVALEAAGRVPDPGNYDLVLANPPYYAGHRIAERFVEAAWEALAPGGTLLLATKQPRWYRETLPQRWRDVAEEYVKKYHLIEAVRP